MTDGTAEGGVISKEIKRIFQRVGEIIDENQKKEQGPERYLEELQPGQEERMIELHLGPHSDCDRSGSQRAMSGDGRGYDRERELGEQDRVPDHVKSTRYGSYFMSGIEDLHPLLGEQKQHIQGRVTCSETKLMIGNQAIGEDEGFNI